MIKMTDTQYNLMDVIINRYKRNVDFTRMDFCFYTMNFSGHTSSLEYELYNLGFVINILNSDRDDVVVIPTFKGFWCHFNC